METEVSEMHSFKFLDQKLSKPSVAHDSTSKPFRTELMFYFLDEDCWSNEEKYDRTAGGFWVEQLAKIENIKHEILERIYDT